MPSGGCRTTGDTTRSAFFAPDLRYSTSGKPAEAVREFKLMVKALHSAGIEVILDVVYNHTAEGNQLGPTLSLRGIDNAAYYRLVPTTSRYYLDFTGCGNTLNMQSPQVLQLIMDSLRYWVLEMHVDGFRFDLASTLARELYEVDRLGAFFDIIHQDPAISQVKLIAEPWDLGAGGYQVGNFPGALDRVERALSRRDARVLEGRRPRSCRGRHPHRRQQRPVRAQRSAARTPASISSPRTTGSRCTISSATTSKHNEANGDDNQDGENNNLSWNCGVEGPTDDPADLGASRAAEAQPDGVADAFGRGADDQWRRRDGTHAAGQQQRLLPGQRDRAGPAGICRSREQQFLAFTRRLVRFRRSQPVLMRRKYFQGRPIRGVDVKDIYWLDPSGREMTDEAWNAPIVRSLGVLMVGDALDEIDERGPSRSRRHAADPAERARPEVRRSRCPASDPTPHGCACSTRSRRTWRRVPVSPAAATYPLQGRTLALFVLSIERRERAAASDATNDPPKPN